MNTHESHKFSSQIEKLFSSGTVILFTCDSSDDFPLLSVSENSKDILGFESSYFLENEHGWSNRIHPEDRKKVFKRFKEVLNEGGGAINEYRFKRKDGTYIWLRDELKLIEDAEGDNPIVYGSSFEITERKKAELALKESKEQYQSVVEHIKDVTYSIDSEGHITFLNQPWEVQTQYSIEESLGKPFWEFVHPRDTDRFKEIFDALVNNERQSQSEVLRILTNEGHFYWAEVYATRLYDKVDEELSITGTVIDVSEEIARLREREEINEQLEKRVEQRSNELTEEIERREQVEMKLQERLSYEQAISQCSSLLLEKSGQQALEKSLETLLQVSHSDRVYMYKNKEIDDELYLEPVMEVCAEGVESSLAKLDEPISYSQVPWWSQKLSENKVINMRVDDLPDKERIILEDQDVQSVLVIPLWVGGEWYGYIGFADTSQAHKWEKNEVRLLHTAADLISAFEKRKMIEKSLVEQRNYTETILNSLPSIYLLMNEDLEHVQWNSNAERYTGYSGEELATKDAYDLIVPEDHEKLAKATQEVRENRGTGTELTLLTKSGEEVPYFWRGYYIELKQKKYFLCVGIDITQQKKTEQKLLEEKRFSEALLESLPGIFYMFDEDGNYERWNQNLLDKSGYSEEEIQQMHPSDLFDDQEYEEIEKEIEEVFKTGKSEVESSLLTKDGDKIPYYFTGQLFTADQKQYLIGVGHDISEQKKAREELRKNEELFRNLFLQAPAAIVMVTPDNVIQHVNNSFEDLFGYTEDELQGKDIDEVLVPEEEMDEAPKMPGTNYSMDRFHKEAQRLTKSGKLVDVFVAGIPVYVDNEPIAGFGMYIDITEQKKYEEEIYTSLKEKHVLLQEIHHRVKNNLAVVSGLIQLQMYETDDEVVRDTLQESESRIQTMALIHEKLYKSQNLSRISCKSYIGDLVETIRSTNDTPKDITVHKDIDDVQLSINKAVPFALLVNEVVTNAFKHAFQDRKEGEIRIQLEGSGDQLEVEIRDDGIGLPEDFDPESRDSLGMTLIHNFMKQLSADGQLASDNGTYLELSFDVEDVNGSSSSGLIDL